MDLKDRWDGIGRLKRLGGSRRRRNGYSNRLTRLHKSLNVLAAVPAFRVFAVNCVRAATMPAEFRTLGPFQRDLVIFPSTEHLPGGEATNFLGV
jgi:hypothetical protein